MKLQLSLVLLFLSAAPLAAADQRRPCGPGSGRSPLRLLFPQGLFGADFRPACRAHDACYGGLGLSKAECDARFLQDMLCACEQSRFPRLCRLMAHQMYRAVTLPVSERFFQSSPGERAP